MWVLEYDFPSQEGPRHHQYENILRYVQKAPDDIRRKIDRTECDELIALKKDSAPGHDGILYGACRCAVDLGSQFLFNAYKFLLEGGTVPEHFAESRTVFIPKTSDIDDNGRIIRSPDALRPLTLQLCCIRLSQRCISSRQMTDNIFEIETTALARVACTPQESGILLTDFAAANYSVNHSWILSVLERTELPEVICRFLRSFLNDSTTHVEFAGATRGHFLIARGVRQGCPASGLFFCNGHRPDLQMAPRGNYSKEL